MGVGFTWSPTQKSSSVLCDPSNSTQLSSTYVTSEVILNNFCTEAEPRPPCSAWGKILLRAATGKVQRQVLETSIRRGATANAVYSQRPAGSASRHRQQHGLPRHQGEDPGRAGGQHGEVQGEGGAGGEHSLLVRHNCQGLHADE